MKSPTKQIVLTAMIGALLVGVQVAFSFIPNVELVTLIIIVSAYLFHPRVTITATFVFCTLEWFVFGFGYWVVAYYIYWPLLAVASLSLKLVRRNWLRNLVAIIIAFVSTLLFGILTSAIDTLFMSSDIDFFTAFSIIYLRGIYFYITHVVSNCIIVGAMFTPLSLSLRRAIR